MHLFSYGLFLCLSFLALAIINRAFPVTLWMNVYSWNDFQSFDDLLWFWQNNRTGVPHIWASLEIIEHLLTGKTILSVNLLYMLSTVGNYALVLWFALHGLKIDRRIFSALCFAAIGLVIATTNIHSQGAAIGYDHYVSSGVLLAWAILFKLRQLRKSTDQGTLAQKRTFNLTLLCAGFVLSITELTRPYIFYILPLMIAVYWLGLRLRIQELCVLLLPIVLLSGSIHASMQLKFGQSQWTNFGGHSMYKSLTIYQDHIPFYFEAPQWQECQHIGIAQNGPLVNSQEFTNCSNRLSKEILPFLLKNPGKLFYFLYTKYLNFISVPTNISFLSPYSFPGVDLYRGFLKFAFFYMFFDFMRMLVFLAIFSFARVDATRFFLALVTLSSTMIFIAGEWTEESRFWVSLCPFYFAGFIYFLSDLAKLFSLVGARRKNNNSTEAFTAIEEYKK